MANWFTQLFASATENTNTIPIGGKIFQMHTAEFTKELSYDWHSIEKLLEDERVYAIVALVSSMCCKAYVGPELYPKNRYTDDKLSKDEEKVMEAIDVFAREIGIKQGFFDLAWQLVTHGDLFEEILKDGNRGIIDLKSIPLTSVTVLEKEDQLKKRGESIQILTENMIAVKKNVNDTNPRFIQKENYIHLSFKNHGVWRDDREGRDTYGIYSIPPIAPLQRLVRWKKKTVENDIIWKNKLLPRLMYKLKMGSIVPSKYSGTPDEKITKATADAKKLTTDFINTTKTVRADDDIVVSDAVDASVLEAKSVNYHSPNDTISQINTLLNTPQGIPSGLLGGDVGGSMGVELAAIFSGIRIDYIAQIIADAFTRVIRSHARLAVTSVGDEIINRLFIHVDPALSVEKFEKIKTAMSMSTMGIFTKGEIRKASGYARLPQLPEEAFPDVEMPDVKKTLKDLEGDVKKEGLRNRGNNRSPQGDRNTMEEQRI